MKHFLFLSLIFLFSFKGRASDVVSMITTDWPPYYSKNIPGGGHIMEIIQETFKHIGKVTSMKWTPWKRAQIEVERGRRLVLVGAFKTPEREKIYHFNKIPLGHTLSGIFSYEGQGFNAQKLEDFKGKRIGHLRGTSVSGDFDKATHFKKKEYNSELKALMALANKKINFIAGDWYVFNSLKKKKNVKVTITKVLILDKNPLYLAFSKQAPNSGALRDQFDKGLKEIKASGKVNEILKRYGF